jgi:hypothetical protein
MTEYTKPIDHLGEPEPESTKSHWYVVDLDRMTREDLVKFTRQFCSRAKDGKPILWLSPSRATELGLRLWRITDN